MDQPNPTAPHSPALHALVDTSELEVDILMDTSDLEVPNTPEEEESETDNGTQTKQAPQTMATPPPMVPYTPRQLPSETPQQRQKRKEQYISQHARCASGNRDVLRERLGVDFERAERKIAKEFTVEEQRQRQQWEQAQEQRRKRQRQKEEDRGKKERRARQRRRMEEQREQDLERRWFREQRRLQQQARSRNRARQNACRRYVTPAGIISEAKLRRKAIAVMDASSTPIQEEVRMTAEGNSEFNGLVLDPTTQRDILERRQEYQHKTEIVLFSDGSMVEAGTEKNSMAFGVVIDTGNNTFVPVMGGGVTGFASSTKAELVGLLAAVLSSPRNATVKIYTDNMAVMQNFQKLVQDRHTATARAKLRTTYANWWDKVAIAVKNQGGIVTVEWIKGHAGHAGNEAADRAAKAAHGGQQWSLAQGGDGEIQCQGFVRQVCVEDDLRQVLKLQTAARNYQHWAAQNRTKEFVPGLEEVEWRSTLEIVHGGNLPRRLFTSPTDCSKRAHRIKKIHGMLPTLEQMKRRKPDLYPDDLCKQCNKQTETFRHIWMCETTLERQREAWWKCVEQVNKDGERAYQKAHRQWRMAEKEAGESGQGANFKAKEPKFMKRKAEDVWDSLSGWIYGVKELLDPEEMEDAEDLNVWKVMDLYLGLVPRELGSIWKHMFGTSKTIASYMATKF
ncbi:hypothetical protein CPC16_011293, partial [Podila verticillata]